MFTYPVGLINPKVSGIPRDGLIGEWLFSGDADDTSGSGYNGVVTDATLTTDRNSNLNSAYLFNGSSAYITLSNTATSLDSVFNNDFSISMWLYAGSVDPAQIIDYRNVGGSLGLRILFNISKISFAHNTHLTRSTLVPTLNVWYHVILRRTDDDYEFFFDTILDSFSYNSSEGMTVPVDMRLAARNFTSPAAYFEGKLDDIRIYNRALTSDEITALYNE